MIASRRLQALQDCLSLAGDVFVSEKRSVQREAMLRRFFSHLSLCATGRAAWESVTTARDSLWRSCQFSLRLAHPASEQYAACRVLEAISIVLGADEDEWVTQFVDPTLRRIVGQASSRVTVVRCAALRAWAMTVTIGAATDTVTAEAVQDVCEALLQSTEQSQQPDQQDDTQNVPKVPVALRTAALDCWALLATLQEDFHIAGQDEIQMGRGLAILSVLKDCIDEPAANESTMALRAAAGECLALIHEARVNLGVMDVSSPVASGDNNVAPDSIRFNDDGELLIVVKSSANGATRNDSINKNTTTTARRFGKGSWEGSQFEILMDEVKQRIAELSTESGHRLSKKAKKEQRATFREYMATIVDDESPEEVINFRNSGCLTLSTWKEIIPLSFVRHSLQSGFQIQMLKNPTLQSMFGVERSILGGGDGGAVVGNFNMSQLEKRLVMSKASESYKNSDQDRRGKRDKRENVKNHFLTADGDDF